MKTGNTSYLNNLRAFTIGLLTSLTLFALTGRYILIKNNFFFRPILLYDLNHIDRTYTPIFSQDLKERFPGTTPAAISTQIGTMVTASDNALCSENPDILLSHIDNGGGLLCSGLAQLFFHALQQQGFTARVIFIHQSLGSLYNNHTLVEVREDNRWVIYDPMFNISFEKDGHRLGAQEMIEAQLQGTFDSIKVIHHGKINYPVDLKSYSPYWKSLYSGLSIYQPPTKNLFAKIYMTPLRYWFGPKIYFFIPTHDSSTLLACMNTFYFLTVAVIPWAIIFLTLLLILVSIFSYACRNNQNKKQLL